MNLTIFVNAKPPTMVYRDTHPIESELILFGGDGVADTRGGGAWVLAWVDKGPP